MREHWSARRAAGCKPASRWCDSTAHVHDEEHFLTTTASGDAIGKGRSGAPEAIGAEGGRVARRDGIRVIFLSGSSNRKDT